MQALERGEKAELFSSARRAMMYSEKLTGERAQNFKIRFEPSVVVGGKPFATLVDIDACEVHVNSSIFKGLMEKSRNVPHRFASYLLAYSISSTLTNDLIDVVGSLSPGHVLSLLKGEQSEEDPVQELVNAVEGPLAARALLKVSALIVLHDENNEGKGWYRFAAPYIHTVLSANHQRMCTVENDRTLKGMDINYEISRAVKNLKEGDNFDEYTLKFMDMISNRTRDQDSQKELLSDIFAAALISTYSKPGLRDVIAKFFKEQNVKLDALSLKYVEGAAETVPVKTERDELMDRIRFTLRNPRLPQKNFAALEKVLNKN
jgi:hypothetical protein